MFYLPEKKCGNTRARATLVVLSACMTFIGTVGISEMFAAPVYAAETQGELRQQIVRYRDLNLSTAQGRSDLDRRIRRAAKQVCTAEGIASAMQHRVMRKCAEAAHQKAWAVVEQRIDNKRLAVRSSE